MELARRIRKRKSSLNTAYAGWLQLKRLLADTMLDNAALKDLLGKNVWSAPLLQGFRG